MGNRLFFPREKDVGLKPVTASYAEVKKACNYMSIFQSAFMA
jgi:hypothetical protein